MCMANIRERYTTCRNRHITTTGIHVFADASSAAYAAAVYFTKDKKASLVFAKSRIASIKDKQNSHFQMNLIQLMWPPENFLHFVLHILNHGGKDHIAKGRLNDNDYELAIDGLIRQAQSEEITEEEIIKWNLYYEEGEI
uniref:Uncharacterized protein n=1 Tax=Brugia malayi TaxID=6279 RepID=A8NPB0_BRUMA